MYKPNILQESSSSTAAVLDVKLKLVNLKLTAVNVFVTRFQSALVPTMPDVLGVCIWLWDIKSKSGSGGRRLALIFKSEVQVFDPNFMRVKSYSKCTYL